LGERLNLRVHTFVHDALIRRFGKDWYMHMKVAEKRSDRE